MASHRDLSSPVPWRRSLRASQARRVQRARRRRRIVRGRAGVTLAVVLSTVAASGAMAQDAATPQGGVSVTTLQHKLGVKPADGVYGPRTRAAVRRFQRRHDLQVDGIAGPQTLAALGLTSDKEQAAPDTGGKSTGASDKSTADAGGNSTAADSSIDPATKAKLDSIAQCESGGNPSTNTGNGFYGKYQFDLQTWQAMGGEGLPSEAPEAEQDRIAAKLLAARGTAPWPNCG